MFKIIYALFIVVIVILGVTLYFSETIIDNVSNISYNPMVLTK